MTTGTYFWPPYALRPSEPDKGRSEPTVVEIENWEMLGAPGAAAVFVDEWPIDAVLKNLVAMASAWYERAKQPRDPLHHQDLRHWIDLTRALANRLPLGGPKPRTQMQAAAACIERLIDWPQEHFTTARPRVATKAGAEFRCSLTVWGLHQLVTAINTGEQEWASRRAIDQQQPQVRLRIPPTAFWPGMFPGGELPFGDYVTAQKRVQNIRDSVTRGHEAALMADILRSALQHGYFDKAGALRPEHTPEQNSYPATPL